MAEKEFSGATTRSAMSGQAPAPVAPVPLKNGFTDVGHPPPHRATEPADQQSGKRDENIPVSKGNAHLIIGASREDLDAAHSGAARVAGPGTDNPSGGVTRTVGMPENAVPSIEQRGDKVILKEDSVETDRPEFEPGKPKPRTDADADPHEVTTPGFQGLDRVNPLPVPQPLNTFEHRGAPNEPRVVGVQTSGEPGALDVVGSESPEAQAAKGETKQTEQETADVKRGHLPEDFPGYVALNEAGEATYAKVRKRVNDGTLTEIPGIGQVTAEKIEEVMAAS